MSRQDDILRYYFDVSSSKRRTAPVGPSKRADEIVKQQAHDAARMRRIHAVRARFDALRDRVRNQYRSTT